MALGGYAAFLIVRSGGFAAALPFFVTTAAWQAFAGALDGVTAVDGPPARLRARTGDDFIAIEGAGEGQVAVSGVLSEPDEEQRLQFRFVTSASGLPALQAGVKRVE